MPVLTYTTGEFNVSNDPEDSVRNEFIDLSLLLSEYYAKQVRQGNSFKVMGASAKLISRSQTDSGAAASVKLSYCPAVKNARQAWNVMFNQWKKQKQLSAKVGRGMRFDDFELGLTESSSYSSDRTSTIYGSGMGDTTTEKCVIWGDSSAGTDYSLSDVYNAMVKPMPTASKDPFTNVVIKDPKFTQTFPEEQHIWLTSVLSSTVTAQLTGDMLAGGDATTPLKVFPEPINMLAGLMKVNVYLVPDDTTLQVADTFAVSVTIHVKSWKPLVYRPKSSKKKSGGRRRGRRTYRKRSRRRT